MSADTLRNCAAQLREFERSTRGSVEVYVELEQDYEVDLGAFGYQSMTVALTDEYYSIDVGDVFDDLPMQRGSFEEMADELDHLAENLDSGARSPLDKLLSELEDAPGGALQAQQFREALGKLKLSAEKALAEAKHDPLAMLPS